MKNAICLISFKPNEKIEYLNFLNSFNNYDIYVIIDDNTQNYQNLQNKFTNINFIQIKDNVCFNSGYNNISYITLKKYVTGWDKAVFYFSKFRTEYSNVWFFEDDVYFNSENTILKIDNKYQEHDILCNSSYSEGKLNEWLWKFIQISFKPPYYCGMMCALRLSRKYIDCIVDYVDKNKKMFFLEAFFPSLAKYYNLKIIENPIEFLSVTFNKTPELKDINNDYLYHPVKDMALHTSFRH
jgi:hypothetical protein